MRAAHEGWEAYATQTGSLRPEYTRPRGSSSSSTAAARPPYAEPATLGHLEYAIPNDNDDRRRDRAQDRRRAPAWRASRRGVGRLLGVGAHRLPTRTTSRAAATTAEDLAALAPEVPVRVRSEVEAADACLDSDVADWFAAEADRPKLTLLGPVAAQAHGKALVERKAYFTELLTYLALRRRHGATPDEVADAFNLKPPKARGYVKVVRDWLGHQPSHRHQAPARRHRRTRHQEARRERLPGRRRAC